MQDIVAEHLEDFRATKERGLRRGMSGHINKIADALDALRMASVDAVEAVQRWRRTQPPPAAPFMWNGVNYLLKMPSDLDHLDAVRPLRERFAFNFRRNPFAVPLPMELRPVSAVPPKGGSASAGMPQSTSGFMDIGQGAAVTSIGDVDMVRVRECERVLLAEEALSGRFERCPITGRLVPEAAAEATRLNAGLAADDHSPIRKPATAGRRLAPHADTAGVGIIPPGDASLLDIEEIQRIARGRAAKNRVARLRPLLYAGAIAVQKVVRGMRGRKRARRVRVAALGAAQIQRVWRGMLGRKMCLAARLKVLQNEKAVQHDDLAALTHALEKEVETGEGKIPPVVLGLLQLSHDNEQERFKRRSEALGAERKAESAWAVLVAQLADIEAEEVEDDMREDAAAAAAAEQAARQYVSPTLLRPPATSMRRRVIVIMMDSTVPSAARAAITARLRFDVPGLFAAVSDIPVAAAAATAAAVAPTNAAPTAAAASATTASTAAATSYDTPRSLPVDTRLKLALEAAARAAAAATSSAAQQALAALAAVDAAPSRGHVLAAAAALTLLGEGTNSNSDSDCIVSKSGYDGGFDAGGGSSSSGGGGGSSSSSNSTASGVRLLTVKQYLAHEEWPLGAARAPASDAALAAVAGWVEAMAAYMTLLQEQGGPPPPVETLTYSRGMLQLHVGPEELAGLLPDACLLLGERAALASADARILQGHLARRLKLTSSAPTWNLNFTSSSSCLGLRLHGGAGRVLTRFAAIVSKARQLRPKARRQGEHALL
ncbi:hypothetical protein JKP88DRAFT_290304 [Tribonema minus]|uniref:Uncharacterized protein n=1 Tax=Tribonema minus TaxID=303371 RepID=A0A835Z0X5_9STRA|nr:hypothetical protein JKP88DRAFT_290304 [Tribonema minus]